jgi:hypothetical protein
MDTETMLAECWKASDAITPERRAALFAEGRKTGHPAYSVENEKKPALPEFVKVFGKKQEIL